MNPLLNRDFALPADGFFQVVPIGEWPITLDRQQCRRIRGIPATELPQEGQVRRLVQVVDAAACAAMQNRFNESADRPQFAGMLWDYDHFSNDPDHSSEAVAWGMKMENRADGLYQSVRFAGDGEARITSGAYRFPSPVWNPEDCEWIGNSRIRPLRLDRVGVTNDPNMKGIRPLSNRSTEPALADSSSRIPEASGRKESNMDYKAALLSLLGQPADASDEAITNACAQHKESARNREAETTALTNRATSAETKLADIQRQALEVQVEKDLDAHAGVIVNRAEWKTKLMADREGTLKLLEGIAKPGQRVLNRAAGTPETRQQETADKDQARARIIRNRAMEIHKAKPRLQFSECWAQAEKESPDQSK